jgi:hypothetical protein
MANPVFLQDLTEEEAQYVQGGAATDRTDLSLNFFGIRIPPIQLTGSPFGGAGADLIIRLLGTDTLPLTPAGSPVKLALIFRGSAFLAGGR